MRAFLSVLAAAALAGCSAPAPAPVVVEAAWNLNFAPSGACSLPDAAFGKVTESTFAPVASEVGDSVSEWTSCIVSQTKPGTFSANATTEEGNPGGVSFSFSVDGISADATEASPARGSIQFAGPTTGGKLVTGPCNFYFKSPSASTEGVEDGRIWCAFACPSVTVGGPSACEVTESFMAYRSCAPGVEF